MKTKHQRFMSVARALARVSDAADLRVGCVVVVDGRVIGSGFNDETASPVWHAEDMALSHTAEIIRDGAMYVTTSPCLACAEKIVTYGIRELYYQHEWWDAAAIKLLREHNIKVTQVKRDYR